MQFSSSSAASPASVTPASARTVPFLAALHSCGGDEQDGATPLVPPISFALMAPGVYRSGHPNVKNSPFLETLHLKSVMYLEDEDLRPDISAFAARSSLTTFHFRIGERDVWDDEVRADVESALRVVLDPRNYPILVFDNLGKAATTLLCSLVRCHQRVSLTSIFAEGERFAGVGSEGGGIGLGSREFIALYEPDLFEWDRSRRPDWVW